MNINAITKHYDKLTAPERFTLLNGAIKRKDKNEVELLQRSAPRKRWDIPTTRGLIEAFQFLRDFHVMYMLAEIAHHAFLQMVGDDINLEKLCGVSWMDTLGIVQARTLSRAAAWVEICAEYGIDPGAELDGAPGVEFMNYHVDIMKRFNEIHPVKIDPAPHIADMRAVIAHYRAEWE